MFVTMRTRRPAPRQRPAIGTDTVCGRPTGIPISSTTVRHRPRRLLDVQARGGEREPRLVGGHVVAGEGVVRPAGQEQDGVLARLGAEVQHELVLLRVAADAMEREAVREGMVERAQGGQQVAALPVRGRARGAEAAYREQAEGRRRGPHPLVREDLHLRRVRHGQQRQAVQEQRLLQLVGDAQLVAAVARPKLVLADADVLVGVRRVVVPGPVPVAHLPAAQEVGHELEAAPVPGVEEGTGRRLAVQLLDEERRHGRVGRARRRDRL